MQDRDLLARQSRLGPGNSASARILVLDESSRNDSRHAGAAQVVVEIDPKSGAVHDRRTQRQSWARGSPGRVNLLVAALGGLELGDESPSIVGTLVAAVAHEEGWGASGPAGLGVGHVFPDA
jgi:hypothetical protein